MTTRKIMQPNNICKERQVVVASIYESKELKIS